MLLTVRCYISDSNTEIVFQKTNFSPVFHYGVLYKIENIKLSDIHTSTSVILVSEGIDNHVH